MSTICRARVEVCACFALKQLEVHASGWGWVTRSSIVERIGGGEVDVCFCEFGLVSFLVRRLQILSAGIGWARIGFHSFAARMSITYPPLAKPALRTS